MSREDMVKGHEGGVSDDALETEAVALRDGWIRLEVESALLTAHTDKLMESDDVNALRDHHASVREHLIRLRALTRAIEAFHKRHGAIGGLGDE